MTTISTDNPDGRPAKNHSGKVRAPSHALAHWEPRHALSLDAAKRHSAFIHNARLVLVTFSGVLLLVLLWYFISAPKPNTPEPNPNETVKMINPVYKGRTADNLPFRITADEAARFVQKPDETKLINPVLNFLRSGEVKESMVLALSGLYNSETQVLTLNQEVHLRTDDGYDCKTNHARVFIKEKRIAGDEKIACSGTFGNVSGSAYEINDNYSEFVFKGGMTALIVPNKKDDAPSSTNPLAPLRGGQE